MINNILERYNDLSDKEKRYTVYYKQRKNKRPRKISAPSEKLKELQAEFSLVLYSHLNDLYIYQDKKYSEINHGFLPGKSIVTNASKHFSSLPKVVINIDLKDFFPSCGYYDVMAALIYEGLIDAKDIDLIPSDFICIDNELAQGSPCSPILANICFFAVDIDIVDSLEGEFDFPIIYTRYADDLTFSFSLEHKNKAPDIVQFIYSKIESFGFSPNRRKTNIAFPGKRIQINNITINEKINLPRDLANHLRGRLYKLGLLGQDLSSIELGYLSYLKSINPDLYVKYIGFYNKGKLKYIEGNKNGSNKI